MKKKEIENITREMALSIIKDTDIELVDVEYIKEGSHMYLRVFIDNPEGTSIEDCQKISQSISNRLDDIDPIEENYFLEVSSPGLDRPLKTENDLKNSIGKDIEISLYKPINGKKRYIGKFIDFDNNHIAIEDEKLGEIKIERKLIAKINLAINF